MSIIFNDNLKKEYRALYNSCIINPSKAAIVNRLITRMLINKSRYETVSEKLNIPWQFIAVIHNMESSLNFSCHLHNGDPLSGRTVHVPAGRPSASRRRRPVLDNGLRLRRKFHDRRRIARRKPPSPCRPSLCRRAGRRHRPRGRRYPSRPPAPAWGSGHSRNARDRRRLPSLRPRPSDRGRATASAYAS